MTENGSTTTTVLILSAITLSGVLLFPRAFGNSLQDSTTDYRLEVSYAAFTLSSRGDKYSKLITKGEEGNFDDQEEKEFVRCHVEGDVVRMTD